MFRVLLVDDEPVMRLALNSIINWNEHDFEVCGTARDGQEALSMIERLNPDIVITDLKMPNMDGIELIRQINNLNYHCKVLVISNYSDFELVREALTLGAVDYLLKINMQKDDLLKQLNAIKQLLKERDSHLPGKNIKKEFFNTNMKSLILRDFFNSNCDDINEFSKGAQLNFYNNHDPFTLFYITPMDESLQPKPNIDSLGKIVSEILSHIHNIEVIPLDHESIVALIPKNNLTVHEISNQLKRALKIYVVSKYSIIYTDDIIGYSSAKESLKLCKKASNILFYKQLNIINAKEIVMQYYLDFMTYRTFGKNMIKHCNLDGHISAQEILDDFIKMCSKKIIEPEIVTQYLCKTFSFISVYMLNLTETHYKAIDLLIKEIPNVSNTHGLLKLIHETLPLIFVAPNTSDHVELVVGYIKQNYKEKLTLTAIAEHVNLNESYLCRIFKIETGTTIISYLNNIRMEEASQLMKHEHLSVNEVCQILNFDSVPYFYRLFKKHFGISPAKFINSNT